MKNPSFKSIITFAQKYKIAAGAVLGSFAGFWGIIIGVLIGYFLEHIFSVQRLPQNPTAVYEKEYIAACVILGICAESSLEEIKKVHRTLCATYHPDTLQSLSEEQQKIASNAFLRFQNAYEVILKYRV